MANTQTTVPTFVPGQVLEAAQLVNSAATGVPVFATTVTRDAGFGGAGEKTLAEGQLCYLESTNVVQYYDGAAWATLAPAPAVSSGLNFVGGGNLSGTSTTFSSVFSATYNAYRILLINMNNTTSPIVKLQLGSATTGYEQTQMYCNNTTAWTFNSSATTFFELGQTNSTDQTSAVIDLVSPFLSAQTFISSMSAGYGTQRDMTIGLQDSSTSFTAFTIFNTQSSSMTGTVQVFGYANS